MSKPNKYHSSGRLYTLEEQVARQPTGNYSHVSKVLVAIKGVTVVVSPEPGHTLETGRNVSKLVAKVQGFKSLKQKIRSQK